MVSVPEGQHRQAPHPSEPLSTSLSVHRGGDEGREGSPTLGGFALTHTAEPPGACPPVCKMPGITPTWKLGCKVGLGERRQSPGAGTRGLCKYQLPGLEGMRSEGPWGCKWPLMCLLLVRLRQPEPPNDGRPPLLHILRSCGDPAQPRGAQPAGASHAAGDAPLCPQAGGRPAGEGAVGARGRVAYF